MTSSKMKRQNVLKIKKKYTKRMKREISKNCNGEKCRKSKQAKRSKISKKNESGENEIHKGSEVSVKWKYLPSEMSFFKNYQRPTKSVFHYSRPICSAMLQPEYIPCPAKSSETQFQNEPNICENDITNGRQIQQSNCKKDAYQFETHPSSNFHDFDQKIDSVCPKIKQVS